MKNFILLIGSIFLLNACTGQSGTVSAPKNNEEDTEVSLPNKTIEISNIQIGDFVVTPDSIDFGQLSPAQPVATQTVVLKNSAETSMPLNLQLEESPGFKIPINRCGTLLAAKATCKVTLNFSSRSLFSNQYNTGLSINGSVIPVVAQVINKPDPSVTGSPLISLEFKDKNFSESDPTPYRPIIVKNIGTGNAKDLSPSVPPEYVLLLNRCPSTLAKSADCAIHVLYRDHRNSAPTDNNVLFSYSAPNNELSLKTIATLTGAVSTLASAYSPVFEASFPASTKTTTCSGTETVYKELIDCKNAFNASVPLSNCAGSERPSLVYNSPEGEFASSQSITGGQLFSSCASGSTIQVPSRVSCVKPAYFEQANLTCGVESFSGTYSAVTNPVPNSCDGTQIVQRPLVSGSCIGANNGPAADSYCAATSPQTFISPAGEGLNPQAISGGSLFYTCAAGLSSKLADSRVVCDGSHLSYGFACFPASVSCNIDNGSGSQAFNQSTGTYNTCLATSCGTDHAVYGGTCHRTFASSCVEAKADGVLNTSGTTASGTFNIRRDSMNYQVTCDTTNNTASTLDATGGTITYSGNYRIHTFTSSGTFTVTSGTGNVQSLVIGGGGGGGSSTLGHGGGGGGGAGGMLETAASQVTLGSSTTVTVGAGGPGTAAGSGQTGNNGNNSSFGSLIAYGGGAGGTGRVSGSASNPGFAGGSGGGGGWNNYQVGQIGYGGSGVSGQGNAGGSTTYTYDGGGNGAGGAGGGGAGSAGNPNYAPANGGAGGSGKASSISGSSVTYAAGGPGASGSTSSAGHGSANSGNGGRGAYSNYSASGNGGSGIVIIRYQYKTN